MKIDKKIPLPSKSSGGRKSKYPWTDMTPGDSFSVVGSNTAPVPPRRFLDDGWKFASRTIEGGFRVWRTK